MKDKWFIFDLDGTIADIDDRRKLCTKENGKMDWDKFFDPVNINLDLPNIRVITMMRAFVLSGFKIAIFSGRSKRTKDSTVDWLNKYDVPYDVLKMRPTSQKWNFMPDDELKEFG